MTTEFDGKHVVITGGSGGLGRAVVAAFLARGATCHLPFVEAEKPGGIPWIDDDGVQIQLGVDLDNEAAVAAYYQSRPSVWASIHLVGGFAMAPVEETSLNDFRRMLALNAEISFLCCREAVRAMRKSGGGRIINVTARPALEPAAGMIAYTAGKAAVAALTQSLAAEVRDEGIWVNAIAPSLFDTPANRQAMPDADFSTWPTPEEIAQTICFLASPQNQLTSGALVPVYGKV